ncbi:hypothetical protein ACFOZ7_11645 [Natribaculum luteum]|uniref:Uncharacterized protein n=1 Tax=Natribaculum luteum TaxID=1586232 RepID=A0ABD5NZW2_9EURY|nr:hypothetical protein [Natribaculum luteum]
MFDEKRLERRRRTVESSTHPQRAQVLVTLIGSISVEEEADPSGSRHDPYSR